ncbi:MAG: DUF3667 domain-containing protein [Saprospiraceae bacterium]|nr:DUF3667 domain-containing protein [Saprospiraceae bacterium]
MNRSVEQPGRVSGCTQCRAPVTGPFCSQCGYRHQEEALHPASFFEVLFEYVTNWEKKLFSTTWGLFRAPGVIINGFVRGYAGRFYHPLKFLLFWGALNFLLANYLHLGIAEEDPDLEEGIRSMQGIFQEYGSFFWAATMPFIALGHYLFKRSAAPQFMHHCVMASYLIGMNLLISMPLFGLQHLWSDGKDVITNVQMFIHFAMCWHISSGWIQTRKYKDLLTAVIMYAFAFLGLMIYFTLGSLLLS